MVSTPYLKKKKKHKILLLSYVAGFGLPSTYKLRLAPKKLGRVHTRVRNKGQRTFNSIWGRVIHFALLGKGMAASPVIARGA